MASQETSYLDKKGLTVKDLVTIGIFTALFFVFELIGGMPLAINPATTFFLTCGISLLCGPVFLLMVAKVPKHGAIVILGIVNGLIWFATGMHWAVTVGFIIMGIVADLVAGIKKFKSAKMNILAYGLLCLGSSGSLVAYCVDPAGWSGTMVSKGTTQEFLDQLIAATPNWILPVVWIGSLLIAALSGFIGLKLLKKQFEKAGITA